MNPLNESIVADYVAWNHSNYLARIKKVSHIGENNWTLLKRIEGVGSWKNNSYAILSYNQFFGAIPAGGSIQQSLMNMMLGWVFSCDNARKLNRKFVFSEVVTEIGCGASALNPPSHFIVVCIGISPTTLLTSVTDEMLLAARLTKAVNGVGFTM